MQNQPRRWPGARDTKIVSIRKYIVGDMGDKRGAKNVQRDPQIIKLMSFVGSRESSPEMTILLIGPMTVVTVNR